MDREYHHLPADVQPLGTRDHLNSPRETIVTIRERLRSDDFLDSLAEIRNAIEDSSGTPFEPTLGELDAIAQEIGIPNSSQAEQTMREVWVLLSNEESIEPQREDGEVPLHQELDFEASEEPTSFDNFKKMVDKMIDELQRLSKELYDSAA